MDDQPATKIQLNFGGLNLADSNQESTKGAPKPFDVYHGHGVDNEPKDWRISMIQPCDNNLSPTKEAKKMIGRQASIDMFDPDGEAEEVSPIKRERHGGLASSLNRNRDGPIERFSTIKKQGLNLNDSGMIDPDVLQSPFFENIDDL